VDPELAHMNHTSTYLHPFGHPRDHVVVDWKFVQNLIHNICHHLDTVLSAPQTGTTHFYTQLFDTTHEHVHAKESKIESEMQREQLVDFTGTIFCERPSPLSPIPDV